MTRDLAERCRASAREPEPRQLPRRERNDPAAHAPLGQERPRVAGDVHLRSGGDQDDLGVVVALQHVAAAHGVGHGVSIRVDQGFADRLPY